MAILWQQLGYEEAAPTGEPWDWFRAPRRSSSTGLQGIGQWMLLAVEWCGGDQARREGKAQPELVGLKERPNRQRLAFESEA